MTWFQTKHIGILCHATRHFHKGIRNLSQFLDVSFRENILDGYVPIFMIEGDLSWG